VWWFNRQRPAALLILRDGLQLQDQPEVLPWSSINDFTFTNAYNTLVVCLHLDPDAPAPPLGKRGKYRKSKHQVVMTIRGLRSKRATETVQTIVAYWRAFHARTELQRMGVTIDESEPVEPS
jgi:hypothetical protein